MTTFLFNRDIYESVICRIVPQVRERIATADIKDMYVDAGGRDMVPFLEVLDEMVKRGRMLAISCKRSCRAALIGYFASLKRLSCSFGSCCGDSGV